MEDNSDRQLFFSTDGIEPETEKPHPESEPDKDESVQEIVPSQNDGSQNIDANATLEHQNIRNPNQLAILKKSGQKKMTWREKKKMRRKQKFKKPRRLPYEETETKPLEIGQLLESEDLKTEEGIQCILRPDY